jgi:hypothetical protein
MEKFLFNGWKLCDPDHAMIHQNEGEMVAGAFLEDLFPDRKELAEMHSDQGDKDQCCPVNKKSRNLLN